MSPTSRLASPRSHASCLNILMADAEPRQRLDLMQRCALISRKKNSLTMRRQFASFHDAGAMQLSRGAAGPELSGVVSSPTAAWGSSRTEANGRPTSLPASLHHCSDDDLLPHGRQRPTHGRQRRAHSIAVSVRATLRHDTAGAFAHHMPWPSAPRDPPSDPGCARQFSTLLVLHFASSCVRENLCPSNKDRIDPRRPLCGGGPHVAC